MGGPDAAPARGYASHDDRSLQSGRSNFTAEGQRAFVPPAPGDVRCQENLPVYEEVNYLHLADIYERHMNPQGRWGVAFEARARRFYFYSKRDNAVSWRFPCDPRALMQEPVPLYWVYSEHDRDD